MIGRTIAHYTITDRLGAGGMGEVFRARDAKLGRDVALKLIPQAFTTDPQRLARFQREAEVLASLNHPNIAGIYGIEAADGQRALVLELVDGPTLEERIEEGALPVDEALRIALEIAEALEAAHERGVIHRDLKPANIKLTSDGRVKVLDFGLAKALDAATPASGSAGLSHSPTMTQAMTGAGVLLGTASFMSPEQARGRDADKRADVWAFGVVLFEMLAGHRLYSGETVSDTLAAVLRAEPDWKDLPGDLPREIRRLLERCLERDVKLRLRDIGEARILLARILAGDREPEIAAAPAAPAAPARGGWPAAFVVPALLLAGVLGAGFVALSSRPEAPDLPLRKTTLVFETTDTGASDHFNAEISPDGRRIAYVSQGRLWIQDLMKTDPDAIETSVAVAAVFWSPDSKWLGFAERSALWKVAVDGGRPAKIATLRGTGFSTVGGGAWDENGRILFSTGNDVIYAVSANGGDPAPFRDTTDVFSDFHEVTALPEGKGWLTIGHRRGESFDTICIVTQSADLEEVLVVPDQVLSNPTWTPSGHILYRRGGGTSGVWALPFSLKSLEATGDPFLVAAEGTQPSAGREGSMAYVLSPNASLKELVSVDRSGRLLAVHSQPANTYAFPMLSPDETRAVLRIRDGESQELWSIDLERKTSTRLTFGDKRKDMAAWSPDGGTLYAYEGSRNAFDLITLPADGTKAHRVLRPGLLPFPGPDGTLLYYTSEDGDDGNLNIRSIPLSDPEGESRALIAGSAAEWWSVPSPDGAYLAYVSDESGENQVYVTSLPDLAGKWQISRNGGDWPRWRADGNEILFADVNGIMATEIDRSRGFRPGSPRQLFQRPSIFGLPWPDGFDISADAERIYFMRGHQDDGEEAASPRIVIVQNWIREFTAGS